MRNKKLQEMVGRKGQISDIFIIFFMAGILGVVLVQVLPVFIDNFISPQLINRDFGTVSLLLWELIFLVFIAIAIIVAMERIKGREPPFRQV